MHWCKFEWTQPAKATSDRHEEYAEDQKKRNWIFLWYSVDRNGPQGLTQPKIYHVKAFTHMIYTTTVLQGHILGHWCGLLWDRWIPSSSIWKKCIQLIKMCQVKLLGHSHVTSKIRGKHWRKHREFHQLIQELHLRCRFKAYFKVDKDQSDDLLRKVGPSIRK